jgi:hypothetical protein
MTKKCKIFLIHAVTLLFNLLFFRPLINLCIFPSSTLILFCFLRCHFYLLLLLFLFISTLQLLISLSHYSKIHLLLTDVCLNFCSFAFHNLKSTFSFIPITLFSSSNFYSSVIFFLYSILGGPLPVHHFLLFTPAEICTYTGCF